ncbi:MAG: TlpA family protein disulfide reductase, partial [Bacteroidetes bacterium]|nr:TlpA family protein disulfide reductase [Bacteroidota bacterium]
MQQMYCLLLALVAGAAGACAQQKERLSVIPVSPKAGDAITLLYHTPSATRLPVSAVLYIDDTLSHWHAIDLPVQRAGDTAWKASYTVPADAGFLAYRFYIGDSADNNNEKGFFTTIQGPQGTHMPGAEAGYGLLRSPRYNLGIPGYFSTFSISDTATYMWLSNEILRHRTVAPHALLLPYAEASLRFKGDDALRDLRRADGWLRSLPHPSDRDIITLYLLRLRYLKDTVGADSVMQASIAAEPHGVMAKFKAYKSLSAVKMEPKVRVQESADFIQTYPLAAANPETDQLLGINYYNVYRNVLAAAIAAQDSATIVKYIHTAPLNSLIEAYYKVVEIPYEDWKSKTAAQVFPMASLIMKRIDDFVARQPSEYSHYSPLEWKRYCANLLYRDYIIHAAILYDLEQYPAALALAEKAQAVSRYRSSQLNELQVLLFQKTGRKKEVEPLLENAIRVNQATGRMIALLKENYLAAHPKATAAETDHWLESLKDAHTMELMREEIKREMKSFPAPDFVLSERNADSVRLAALKGKIVVLDFWATWCAPCKAGMAGMKMVADKYGRDSNVVFFFVDTQERTPDYRESGAKFLSKMGYNNFRVLYDNGEETYKKYATLIRTSGIPFKIVINRQGRLNFANVGYKGSPTGLADEITAMIEFAR